MFLGTARIVYQPLNNIICASGQRTVREMLLLHAPALIWAPQNKHWAESACFSTARSTPFLQVRCENCNHCTSSRKSFCFFRVVMRPNVEPSVEGGISGMLKGITGVQFCSNCKIDTDAMVTDTIVEVRSEGCLCRLYGGPRGGGGKNSHRCRFRRVHIRVVRHS